MPRAPASGLLAEVRAVCFLEYGAKECNFPPVALSLRILPLVFDAYPQGCPDTCPVITTAKEGKVIDASHSPD